MSLQAWRELALAAPRAAGEPQATGRLRAVPEDFVVEEDLGFLPDGDGSHLLLKVRKRNANTGWVAQELARALGCHVRDIGFAGQKDRRAVAVQWFTLPATPRALAEAASFSNPEFVVLEAHRHRRKLPRGALAGNTFVIRIRDYSGSAAELRERCELIRRAGVPNYFGPQRFGREAANLARLLTTASAPGDSRARPGRPDAFVLSAARSLIFNALLGERVRQGSWDALSVGDVANLDGRGSVFVVDALTPGARRAAGGARGASHRPDVGRRGADVGRAGARSSSSAFPWSSPPQPLGLPWMRECARSDGACGLRCATLPGNRMPMGRCCASGCAAAVLLRRSCGKSSATVPPRGTSRRGGCR